jgi:hypothetical protein
MNDFILIFMGIFILLLMVLVFLLLAYVYNSYTTYTVDINKNLETSEKSINNTSNAFNKLQDNVINELAKVNKNQEIIVKNVPNNLIALNSNILNMFQVTSNNIINDDITKSNITINGINVVYPFTAFKNFTSVTDANNSFNICNSETDPLKRSCIQMKISGNNFNIFSSNANSSNIQSINIYDSNNGILASFDTFNKNISLGSNVNPAISINNNVYTPDTIVCKYTISDTDKTLKLNLISNKTITSDKVINIPIINDFIIKPNQEIIGNATALTTPTYNNNVLKFKLGSGILANTIERFTILIDVKTMTTINPETVTTTGYISAT